MNETQQKDIDKIYIDHIYSFMADTDLTLWCKVLTENGEYIINEDEDSASYITAFEREDMDYEEDNWMCILTQNTFKMDGWEEIKITKIIWHPVLIGDILNWIQITRNDIKDSFRTTLDSLWNDYRKPIEDQSSECIEYIYHLTH